METFRLKDSLKVFGVQVKTFPAGIGEAFDGLVKMLGGFDRAFYGVSWMSGNDIIYYAVAPEKYDGESEKYNCESLIIEKGNYLIVMVTDWRSKTDSIKDIFHTMMQDSRADKTKPCVEWYKSDSEMLCMVKNELEG